ncbi:hypothetical protein H4S02_005978 [Coemansia sp. RSA 2611]|nr:hypothetical protein H4S02_005978 [Coemansia sp. RSA 2611]
MKTARCFAAFCALAIASVAALPTSPTYPTTDPAYSSEADPQSPYDKCVAEHGGQAQFPYPGPGECHTLGHCECMPNGSIGCVC